MKAKLIGLTLFGLTAAAVVFYPAAHSNTTEHNPSPEITLPVVGQERPRVEVVFVLDTTSSMSGLIDAAKEKIWSIANTMASAQPAPELHMGLVAFRDRGDAYVTRVTDLSQDLDSLYATLLDFRAQGGGDGPESVNQALYDAVHSVSWSQDPNVYKVVFLVGDAPPHMDYQDDVPYPVTIAAASRKGIVVNTIQSGAQMDTRREWMHIASLSQGEYFEVGTSGGALAVATPFDEELARLSAELDETRLFYGSEEERAVKQKKIEASDKLHAKASVQSRARRAAYNTTFAGEVNLFDDGDLVSDVESGRVDLEAVPAADLPTELQSVSKDELKTMVGDSIAERNRLQSRIEALAEQRTSYLKEQVAELEEAADSLDHKLLRAIEAQAPAHGLALPETPSY